MTETTKPHMIECPYCENLTAEAGPTYAYHLLMNHGGELRRDFEAARPQILALSPTPSTPSFEEELDNFMVKFEHELAIHVANLDNQFDGLLGDRKEVLKQNMARFTRHYVSALATRHDLPIGLSNWIEYGQKHGYYQFEVERVAEERVREFSDKLEKWIDHNKHDMGETGEFIRVWYVKNGIAQLQPPKEEKHDNPTG
jgi:hypothetical protein